MGTSPKLTDRHEIESEAWHMYNASPQLYRQMIAGRRIEHKFKQFAEMEDALLAGKPRVELAKPLTRSCGEPQFGFNHVRRTAPWTYSTPDGTEYKCDGRGFTRTT